jgi:hypothetical protein
MARAMPMETNVFTVLLAVCSMKVCIGVVLVVTATRSGAPSSTAVVGINSAATVMTSDHRIAVAILRLDPLTSSERLTGIEYPL